MDRTEERKGTESESSRTAPQAVQHTAGVKKQSQHEGQSKNDSHEHDEGTVAKMIEQQTAKLPSDLFLWAAGASILGSLSLAAQGQKHASLFVGQWVSPFLILGLYNKLVKVAGSDQTDQQSR